ncbi:phosphoribosylanthranilate isomerase [Lysinibacillus sp. 2017]|uniref:phosphoribosylanthranilate isomerase n=1 Tax=unclassified Lysinibacillus TaxID=2636778 RepID=UPI000D52A28B|nr:MULTISPECIES: phosphoribosylanthranilate isomerase [unclassified Lysinibacillus]AWE06229.1 phosphoribosylanthranilate isomerase [Lysinibacillus sp. 2017]TGN35295.1 phosphoribosylanthranilate isomerase [Lysinibacillus sp. S2017]
MTKVKICGLKEIEHVEAAVKAGADFIGLMFAPSKRQITMEQAIELAKVIPSNVKKVGVFVNEKPETIKEIAQKVGLHYIQYHGDETPDMIEAIGLPAIKAFSVQTEEDVVRAARYQVDYYLFDALGTDYRGGSGKSFDWLLLDKMKIPSEKIILAGGLNDENVGLAIMLVEPFAVDVSSGVEIDGRKSSTAIANFIEKAKGELIL